MPSGPSLRRDIQELLPELKLDQLKVVEALCFFLHRQNEETKKAKRNYSRAAKARWQDPKFMQNFSASIEKRKKAFQNQSEQKKLWANAAYRKRQYQRQIAGLKQKLEQMEA
jgi:hypothetical protein